MGCYSSKNATNRQAKQRLSGGLIAWWPCHLEQNGQGLLLATKTMRFYGKLLFSATFCASNCYSVLHSVHQTAIHCYILCIKLIFSATFCASNRYSVLYSVHQTAIQGLRSQFWHLTTHFWSLGAQFWPSITRSLCFRSQFLRLRAPLRDLKIQFWTIWP